MDPNISCSLRSFRPLDLGKLNNSFTHTHFSKNNLVSFACDSPEGGAPPQSESARRAIENKFCHQPTLLVQVMVPPFLICLALDKSIFLSFCVFFLNLEMLIVPTSQDCCDKLISIAFGKHSVQCLLHLNYSTN